MLTVKFHSVSSDIYTFHFNDGVGVVYRLQDDGSLLGEMRDDFAEQYKAVQAYAKDNLGGLTVRLSFT